MVLKITSPQPSPLRRGWKVPSPFRGGFTLKAHPEGQGRGKFSDSHYEEPRLKSGRPGNPVETAQLRFSPEK